VGTVCLSLAAKGKETQTRTFLFVGDREMIRDRSAKMGLSLVRYHLVGEPSPF
jgi:nicotinamide mononucleotide (NMN) deamidase PncC